MSKPANPLGEFRTYAYHQFLVVTNSSTTAEALSKSDVISDFRSNFETDFRDRFIERTESQTGGSYVVLIDGLSDSLFSIKSAKWMSFMQPTGTESGLVDQASAELDGELIIVEPQGVNFLNELARASDTLRSDPNGLVFVLKTIFVGQLPNGQTRTISNIRALTFVMVDVTAIIDFASTEYTLAFVGAVNGAGFFPYVQQVARGRSISVGKGDTVASALKGLAKNINKHWEEQRNILQKQAKTSGRAELQGLDFEKDFRKVTYKITPDAVYEDARFEVGDNLLPSAENKGTGDAVIQPGQNVGIVECIKRIMDSSDAVMKEAELDDAGKSHIFKIYPVLKSEPDNYIVEYFVKRYEISPNPFQELFENKIEPQPGQFIQFDYIFTGQNTDIIDYDMKMQMGLAFFQTLGSSNNIIDQTSGLIAPEEEGATAGVGGRVRAGSTAATTKRDQTPLFLGMTLTDPLFRHVRNPLDTISFQSLLSRWAGYENVMATLKIHGNPELLDEMTPLPSDMDNPEIRQPIGPDDPLEAFGGAGEPEGGTINPAWPTKPGLVKINVKMPARTDFGLVNQTFWYDGFYHMYAVNNVFDDGLFTQELELFSVIIDDISTQTTDEGPLEAFGGAGPETTTTAATTTTTPTTTTPTTPIGGPVAAERSNILTNELRRTRARNQAKGEERQIGDVLTVHANLGRNPNIQSLRRSGEEETLGE